MAWRNAFLAVIFSTTIIVVNAASNCSTYDPCGAYGYCRDNAEGDVSCECKFWWNGTYCNVQTNSGIQVIVLGCLLAVLLIIFYGLAFARWIRNRRRRPKVVKEEILVKDPKLLDIALKRARRKARLPSLLVLFFTLLVAAAGILSKWSLIQPIHNEIVNRYLTDQPIYYEQNSFCDIINLQDFNVLTFPVACFLILVFIIRTKRSSLLRDKCYGYGAPPMPVDFISHIDRKFAAVVFAVCADELINILQEAISGTSTKGDGVILTYLIRLLQVLIMGIRYFPMLAAVYMNTILSLSLATIYTWFDYAITILDQGMCSPDFYPSYDDYEVDNSTSVDEKLAYFGTGSTLVALQLCMDIPRFLCLAYIIVKLPMLLITKLYYRFKKDLPPGKRMLMKLTREQRIFFRVSRPDSIEMLYVKNLFRSANQRPRSQKLIGRLIPKKIYEWRDDFRFSARILCVYSSIFLLLYYVAFQACIQVLPLLSMIETFFQTLLNAITSLITPIPDSADDVGEPANSETSNFPLPSLIKPYLFAVAITLIIIVIQLLVLLVNIRRNLFQSFRGDDTEIPRRQRSKYVSYSSGNVHFAGYFIGYLIWGFIIIAVFVSLICISIQAFITFGDVRFIEKILKIIIPSILFIFFKQYLNKFLATYVFLQHHGDVLALNNRRILMIFIYFNFFLDAFLGFISSIVRLLKSVIGGILYMCRLDYSPLGRKLETMDGGFSSYCGFIHTECTHRHPVMLVFVSHLYTQIKLKELERQNMHFDDLPRIQNPSRYVRKWKLAVFLIRNPTIVFFRKAYLNQLYIDEIHAINDIDNEDKKNLKDRLDIYVRRMSASRPSVSSYNVHEHFNQQKF